MDSGRIALARTSGKVISVILLLLLVVSFSANIYQQTVIRDFRKHGHAEQHEILAAATEAFKQYYKSHSNDNLDAHLLDKFDRTVIYDKKAKLWSVEFRYRVEGNAATTIYFFIVTNNYVVKFDGVSQSGSL